MKKLFLTVLMMLMLIATATISGAVLAAEPYQFVPEDGLPVVYVSKTGDVNSSVEDSNGNEYTTLNDAVKALAETGGYVVLLEDVEDTVNDVDDPATGPTDTGSAGEKVDGKNGGRRYQFPTTSGKKVIIRGRDDLEEFPKIYLRYMCSVANNSEYAFENVHLYWRKFHRDDNDQSLQCGQSKVTFGKEGDPDSIQITGMETITGSKFTINGGTFSIRMALWGSTATVSDVNIILNGGTLKNISGAFSGFKDKIYGTECTGDFCITVNGGTYTPSGLTFGQPTNNKFNVGGDYKLTINGGTISAGTITPVISGKTPAEYSIGGNTIVDISGYTGDKAALESKFSEADWDVIISDAVYISDDGNDSNAGTADAPVASYEKALSLMGSSNGTIYVDGSVVLDNVTEADRSNIVYIKGASDNSTLIINGDYSMGGSVTFSDITLKNGTAGAIVANGKPLVIEENISTAPNEDGTYIDIIAGMRDGYVPVDITIRGGTYNTINPAGEATGSHIEVSDAVETIASGVVSDEIVNALNIAKGTATNATIELIDFVADTQAAKISPVYDIVKIDCNATINAFPYSFAFIDYYLHLSSFDDLEIVPELVINGKTYKAERAAANGWNVATFDISDITDTIETFSFFPYGQVEVNEYNKLYCMGITFSQLKSSVVPDYGEIDITSKGDYIPVLDDYVMSVEDLINTAGLVNTTVMELPFVIGTAAVYTPTAASDVKVQYFTIEDLAITAMIGAFHPYVRVEYYMYARESDYIGSVYPTLKIGNHVYTAAEKLVANQWAVATFNIADYVDSFTEFEFSPYGVAANLNEWNKMYVQKIVFSQQKDTSVPAYANPDMTENGVLKPYVFDPKEEGLEDHPVIYVNVNGGMLDATNPIENSTNSSVAYGSLSAAFSAANKSNQVVYLVLVNDIVVGDGSSSSNLIGYANHSGNLPSNTNTIIIRGMEKTDGTRTKFMVSRMPRANGPLWFQNIDLVSVSRGDTYIALQGNNMSFGAPNGDDNDVTFGKYNGSCTTLAITFGGDGGSYTKNPVVDIYSGTINTTLKLSGAYGATTINGDVTVNIHGGNLSGMSVTNGHSVADKNIGDININISGGTIGNQWEIVNNSNSYIEGDINVKISGKPNMSAFNGFTIAEYKADNTTGHNGCAFVDLLDYEGSDFEALKAKLSNFDVKYVNYVYLTDGGTGGGTSADNAYGSFEDAFAACYMVNDDGTANGGEIVICGDGYTIDGNIEVPENSTTVSITSTGAAALKFASGVLAFNSPVSFKNIKIENTSADDAYIVANGNEIIFDSGITSTAADGKYVSVVGGNLDSTVDSVDVTINSGDFQDVLAGGSVTGDVSIVINGGTIHGSVVGGTSVEAGVIGGNTSIKINGGEFEGSIIGGSSAADGKVNGNTSIVINDGEIDCDVIGGNTAANGYVQGTSNIVVNGGKFGKNSAVVASNAKEAATVNGNASITINSGDFDDMADGQINAGVGCNEKTLNLVNYSMDFEDLLPKINIGSFDILNINESDKGKFESVEGVKIIYNYNGIRYEFDKTTGVLTLLEIDKKLTSYFLEEYPWDSYITKIKKIIVNEGVTVIPAYSFMHASSLESVELASTINTINNLAFYGCTSLTSINIPASISSIQSRVFTGCSSLTSITVDANNPVYCSENGILFNKSKTQLQVYPAGKTDESYAIPETVISVYEYAFAYSALKHITIPKSVTSIKNKAQVYIGPTAFYNCLNLTSIMVDAGNTCFSSDENGVLFNKDKTVIHLLPVGKNTKSYIIPDTVETIDNYVFAHNSQLSEITIPESVTKIGSYAFYECTALTDITIPKSVETISTDSFYNCSELKSVKVDEESEYFCNDKNGALFNKDMTILYLYFADQPVNSYVIPNTVETISSYAFMNNEDLTKIIIPDSVTQIDLHAFRNVVGLTSIEIPQSVSRMDSEIFSNCINLKRIIIHSISANFNADTFEYCSDGIVIYGHPGSTVEKHIQNYGEIYGLTFADINTLEDTEDPIEPDEPDEPEEPDEPIVPDENAPTIKVGTATGRAGDIIEVPVMLVNNPGIWGLDAVVAYDTSILTLTEVVNGEVFDDSALTIGPLDLPTYKLSYENTGFENTNTNGVLATLKFTVNEDAEVGTYPITVSYNTGDIINSDEETLVFATVNGEVEIIEFIYGDVNNDGAINKLDSLRLKKYLANLDVEIHPLAADVNADGTVNKLDSLRLKKFLANLDVTLGK